MRKAMAWAGAALCAAPALAATASVPWTPSIQGRHAIELLVDDAGLDLTVTQWPLPRDAVQHAIDALPPQLPEALAAARDRVQAELHAQQGARLTVTAREHADALTGFGEDATPGSSLELRTAELDGPHFAAQIAGRLDPADQASRSGKTARLDDSAIVTEAYGVELQAWAHRSWWSPGWQNALPLGNNAPALDGIGLQRASASRSESPWLSWLGPWNADFFVARTVGESSFPGANPLVSGARITFKPFSHLEIGLTKMAQWGGDDRSESLRTFADIMLGLHTNADTVKQQALDPGNELAGYDVRVRCPDGVRCTVYGQFIGEDEAGYLPTKFLNMLGTEIWSADGVDRFFVEGAETSCRDSWKGSPIKDCAYRNYDFAGGFTSGQRWLGDSLGSDGRLVTFGWLDSDWNSSVRVSVGYVGSSIGDWTQVGDNDATRGRLHAVSARRSFAWGPTQITPEFDWNRVDTPLGARNDTRLGVEMSVGLDDLGRGLPARLGDALSGANGGSPMLSGLTAAALIGGSTLLDRPANRYAVDHHDEPSLKLLHGVGDVLPFAEFGLAGAAWLTHRGSTEGDVAFTSLESGLTAAALAEVIKFPVDRSRPSMGLGPDNFGTEKRSDSSFPSLHTTVAWSVLTPVAEQYDAPWLYGVAAVTNFARVVGRDHWFSDTVAGSVLGWYVGDWFWRHAGIAPNGPRSQVMVVPHGVVVSTTFQ